MIRRYRKTDAKAVRYIAHSDMPSDAMNAVCAVRCDYYIDFEPEHGFVIVDEFDKPVGYILCSVNRERFDDLYPTYIAKLKHFDRKMYSEHAKLFKQTTNLPEGYTARFAISVLPSFQGKGRGKALVQRLIEHLRGMEIDGTHIVVSSPSVAAFCERVGLERLLRVDKKHSVYGIKIT